MIKRDYSGLSEAAGSLATPQLRNVGTVGGNLCQRPRCWYYRDAQMVCRKKGGSQCFAAKGRNKYHAIFGGGICHIVYPSDLAPMLIALDAQVTVSSPRGERSLPLGEFYALPSKNVRRENVLATDELVREVKLPLAKKGTEAHTSSSRRERPGTSPWFRPRSGAPFQAAVSAKRPSSWAVSLPFRGGWGKRKPP